MATKRIILSGLFLALALFSSAIALQKPQNRNCLTCSMPTGPDARIKQFKGRWIALCSDHCRDEFNTNPDLFFLKLQARGALFDESSITQKKQNNIILYLGSYLLIGLIFGAISAYIALTQGHNPTLWFFIGLGFNILAMIAILIKGQGDLSKFPAGIPPGFQKISSTYAPLPCPNCQEENHPAASACSHCGAKLNPTIEPETKKC